MNSEKVNPRPQTLNPKPRKVHPIPAWHPKACFQTVPSILKDIGPKSYVTRLGPKLTTRAPQLHKPSYVYLPGSW